MIRGEILPRYESMSAGDRHAFDGWLKANAAIGSMMAFGLVLMALSGANSLGPNEANADSPQPIASAQSAPLSP